VTRFELELGPGVKVSRVPRSTRTSRTPWRRRTCEFWRPSGRSAIGVEVPNRQRSLVALGDLLNSEESLVATHPLDYRSAATSRAHGRGELGRDAALLISGRPARQELAMNSLITALVMRATPDQCVCCSLTRSALRWPVQRPAPPALSSGRRSEEAAGALHWAVKEMERRYDILASAVRRHHELSADDGARRAHERADQRRAGRRGLSVRPACRVTSSPTGPEELPYIVMSLTS